MAKKPAGLLQSINSEWLRRIEVARKAREPWSKTAEICTNFYQGSVDFMWGDDFRRRYFSNIPSPKFKITLAKAFEYVALVGPTVFWDYAQRVVRPYSDIDIQADVFGDDAIYQKVMADYNREKNKNKTRCSLLEAYLNYAQQEQPNGGLVSDSQLAVTDALITGRGCLWTESYSFPGSDRKLTGSFFAPSNRLFIDPDSRMPNFSDATWIARQHIEPRWMVERRFGYKDGALKTGTTLSDDEKEMADMRDDWKLYNARGKTHDMVVWYEVFSKCGVGTRGRNASHMLHDTFESEIGDYAYLCVMKGIDHPLNLRNDILDKEVEEVKAAIDWPCPFYKDSRWPVAVLDFYPNTSGPWPIAPLAPGLGELIFLNVLISCLAGRVWENSRNIKLIMKQAGEEVISEFKSGKYDVLAEVNQQAAQSINELVSYLQTPNVNMDAFQMIELVSTQFDKRVGLTEFMYGMTQGGKVLRTAADVSAKQEAVSIRPQYMSRCVEKWQGEVANLDRLCAGWSVSGADVSDLLGDTCASLWDEMIHNEDPEVYFRGMKCTVVADSTARPNKDQEFDALIQIAQYLGPTMQSNAQATGDYSAWNEFVKALCKVRGIDATAFTIGNMPPPQAQVPPPQEQAPVQEEEVPPESVNPMDAMSNALGGVP